MDLEPGRLIGPYRVISLLGKGGMGTVCLAVHTRLDRQVALKILTLGQPSDPTDVLRFQREARAAVGVSHPSIVKVFEYGQEGDLHYISMEVVQGETLAEILTDRGPLPVGEAVRIVRDLLGGLDACHRAGLVHRDLKPANVMLDEQRAVKLLDLGLSKQVDRTLLTQEGARIGSPRFMSPEMILVGAVDLRSDIYQVGLILYECLAGGPAFHDTSLPRLVEKIVKQPHSPLPTPDGPLGPVAVAFVDRALAKDPALRYSSCSEALEALEPQRPPVRSRPVRSVPGRRPSPADRPGARLGRGASDAGAPGPDPRRRRSRWLAAGVAMVTLLALSVGGLMLRGRPAGLPSPTVSPTAPTAPTVRRPTLSDLAPIVGPTWLTVVFTTPEPLAARLSVEPGGLTTADAAPRHSHRLTVRGLAPGTRYDMRLVALDGVELASRRVKAPPAERVAAELVRLLEWSMQALSRATEMAMGPQSDRAARERFGLMWRARCQSWAAAPDLRFWSDALEAVNDRIFLRFETTVATHERLVRRIERLLDLERFLKAASPVDPGLPTDRIRLPAPLTSPPAALEPVAALRFADGGAAAGRPALETAARAVAVDPPARFSADKAGFLSGGMHDAASRYDYEHPATWGPRRRSRELYLRYRVSGGSPVEKLVVQFLDGSAWIEAACLRVPEPPAPFEGWLRIDPRLLDRPARVRIVAERHSPGFLTRGIVLDHLALYAR